MNLTKIEWTDYTWSPITGCLNDCWYCYARRMAKRWGDKDFKPTFHLKRFYEPEKLKKPSKIFVCSMGELFGDWISDEDLYAVLEEADYAPQHTYQFLTKNPKRYIELAVPGWAGVTVTSQDSLLLTLGCLSEVFAPIRFISFEPLLGPIKLPEGAAGILDWIIIGRMTGPGSNKYIPDFEWVADILNWSKEHDIPCFIKDNLGWWSRYQEFPQVREAVGG